MEKKKLKLDNLKVDSFVTTIDKNQSNTINGQAAADSLAGVVCLNSLDNWCPISTPFRFRVSPLVSRDGNEMCTLLSIDGKPGCTRLNSPVDREPYASNGDCPTIDICVM